MPPPGTIAQTITIWHSWSPGELQILDFVLKNFQGFYPDTAFDLLYVPQDELYDRYEMAVYRGVGPSLLFGPAEWGARLYQKGLVADLSQDADPRFLAEINTAALGAARYRNALTGLPLSIRGGVLLYRNKALLPNPPASWEELGRMAQGATRGGKVGAYLERSFLYSAAHLYGLGGRLMDEAGNPAFNTPQGVEWLHLLAAFEQAGAAEFNADRDLDLFKEGRVGLIIDGSWNLEELVEALGEENLAIDPWPAAGTGRLSGFVQADNIFLNANLSGEARYAALLFAGFMLAREVQATLARGGHIPSVVDIEVQDPFMRQIMVVFEGGTPYPADPVLDLYWDPLETALRAVFDQDIDPQIALEIAEDEIKQKLQGESNQ
jgi:arabinogalactan oligomer/maltooligosaccharide transport system substrate-binding protein